MRLSDLQQFTLLACWEQGSGKLNRTQLMSFYATKKGKKPSEHIQVKIITKSIERMIDKELLRGYGVRTHHKWFIREIKLTTNGKKEAQRILKKRQQKLPLKKSK